MKSEPKLITRAFCRAQYTQGDERIFLDGLGRWGEHRRNRKKCLLGYISGMQRRQNLGGLSRRALIEYAKNLLKLEG